MGSPQFPKLRGESPKPGQTQDNVSTQLQPIAKALSATPIMGAPPPDWIKPDLANGYSNTAGGFDVAGYHKDALGYVHIKGSLTHVAGTAAATTAFTLPKSYRPLLTQRFSVRGDAGAVQAVVIANDGQVSNDLVIAAAGTIDLALSFLGEG